MLNNIKAVIFDLDGTLVDSMWLWRQIDIDYLVQFGHDLPDDLQNAIEGKSFSETARYFKERFDLEDDVDTIKSTWNKMAWDYYTHKVTLKDQAEEFLNHLKEHKIQMGIGSSNSKELVSVVIDRYMLHDYFNAVCTSCEVEKGKPHPDVYLKVARDLGVKPEECLVFEDVPNGILAAKRAGMKVCAIYDDFSKEMTTEKKKLADYYIESFTELIALLKSSPEL